jgi:hypothetical protein
LISSDLPWAVAVAALCTGLMLLAWVREALPSPDEGYLWYGALRTLDGEVPLRDFRSYEPGRYYWCALWIRALGRGVVPLRLAVHAFYFLGLTCALLALRLSGIGWPSVVAAGILLAAWAHKPYKLFEPALAMFAVLAGVVLITHPGYPSTFAAGAVAGAISFFGINYSLYAGAGLLGLTLLEGLKSSSVGSLAGLGVYLLGALVGALPLLLWFVCARGAFSAFFERRFRTVVARRRTNLPLPLPWPWRPAPDAVSRLGWAGWRFVARLIGIYFLLLPAFAWPVAAWAATVSWPRIQAHAALAAAAAVGTFSLHHAFSRADLVHLAQSMPPVILGLVALAGTGLGWLAVGPLLGFGAVAVILAAHPRAARYRRRDAYVRHDVGGSSLWISRSSAELLDALESVVRSRLEPEDPLLAVPTLAELLPILDRRSAVYDIYCMYPASRGEQERMLRSIDEEAVRLALVRDDPLDGREELRFSRTHPLVWSHLVGEFEPLELRGLPPHFHVLFRERPREKSGSGRTRQGDRRTEPGSEARNA